MCLLTSTHVQWVSSSLKDTKNNNLCVSDNGSVAEGLARQGYRNLLKCTRGLTEAPQARCERVVEAHTRPNAFILPERAPGRVR